MEEKLCTILLTSAGGLTGTYLSKHFRKTGLYRIVAVDMAEITAIRTWVDAFYLVPAVREESYIPSMKKVIKEEKADIIIPISSYDVDLYSQEWVQDELGNIKMLLMDFDDHIKLHNKETCYKYLAALGIGTPHIFSNVSEAIFPCLLKPVMSSGSKNTVILENQIDFEYWSKKVREHILCEYIEGKEYTVDCLFDQHGKCLGANVRERLKTNGGGAVITRNDYTQKVDKVISILEKTGKIKGPINFQFKRLENGECCLFDFNTRFPSGGLPLTVESGFDVPNKLIQLIQGKHVEPWNPDVAKNGLTMIRYYEEVFIRT